jgi:hypothetical protein
VPRRPGPTKVGCLLYILLVAALLYFGIPIGEKYFKYLEYKDAMKQELRFRSNMPNDKIAAKLKLVADSLGLPEEAGDVLIERDGTTVTVEAEYEEEIQLPLFKKTIHFTPRASDTY